MRKKKRWVRLESLRPPPPLDGPRPSPLCEQQRWGGGKTGAGPWPWPWCDTASRAAGRVRTAGPDDARGSRGPQTRPAAVTGVEPTRLGRLSGASRKRGPWAPLCEGRGRGAGSP